jgi:putative hydrolase of the HAD superfamily
VLLDGLGTLLALAPPWPAFVRRLRERGLQLDAADAERAFRAEIAYYRAHHHEGRDAAALADLRRRCAEALREELPAAVASGLSRAQLTEAMLDSLRFSAYPDAPPALAALRARGLRLVVVSNWDVSLPTVLADAGLAEALDGVLTSAAVGAPKPAPAIFAAALELAGVAPERAVHVGDSLAHDVAGARGAGVAPVLLCRDGEGAGRNLAESDAGGGDIGGDTGNDPAADLAQTPPGVPVIASLAELLT